MDLQRRFIQRSCDDRSFGNNVFPRIVTQYDYNKLARHMNPELQEVIERAELEIKMPKLITRQWQHWDFPDKAIYITTKQYANYVGNEKTAEFLSRKVIAEIFPFKLGLSDAAVKKLIEMAGPRYNPKKKMIKITATERPNREMNTERIKWQVSQLIHQSRVLVGEVN
ncbi:hypothetical protein GUITHDRAFT_108496 [Guillardia theta CCMP2712]|uniref:Small ribosomal subunit protein mS35 mitochondrial conserved domain-containing protein n=1 Tax=Guillardia theta (strain CCMP2712) TaxID=905079 RepID=L1JBZ8_GUITC|nr:hypothetical protein GUITHDRAFT_108496 [Guillardia theta CCMP2712]EKX45620.1 hypothetical protein GUITHDRAFT_108496 [Guillardia theta CCMP2712]|eukprot:XP_005832600.1 hypothetical protein GUITHDRAFT_108496 [Guillardia theta CCMP2712]